MIRKVYIVIVVLAQCAIFFSAISAQPTPAIDTAQLNIITFTPLKAVQENSSLPAEFAQAEKGIKQVIERIKQKYAIDTHVLVSNAKTKKQTLVRVHRGVPSAEKQYDTKTIFIYSPGLLVGPLGTMGVTRTRSDGFNKDINITISNGVGAFLVYRYMRFGLLNGTTVTFDYPTDARQLLNGGQRADVVYLKAVYDEVVRNNPQANIVFVGDCKGGTTILNVLTHPEFAQHLTQVKGAIIESPPLSFKHMASAIANGYLGGFPGTAATIHGVFRLFMPSYKDDPQEHTVLNAQKEHIPTTLPLLIGHIHDEELIANEDMVSLVKKLRSTGNPNVCFYECPRWVKDDVTNKEEKIRHARLGQVAEFQHVVNAFCQQHGFPCDELLVQQGKVLFEKLKMR